MANTYTAEVKAQVIAEWKAGSSLGQLVKAHGIPKATVQNWVSTHERLQLVQVPNTKTEPYDLDKMAVELVDGSRRAILSIYRLAEDIEWLRSQNAADVAVLGGVISDKLYRLLGAITGSSGPSASH